MGRTLEGSAEDGGEGGDCGGDVVGVAWGTDMSPG